MDCAEARRMADAWESGERFSADQIAAAIEHIDACEACRRDQPVFLALAGRNAGEKGRRQPSAAAEALADRVMAEITPKRRAAPARTVLFRPRRTVWLFAAGAAVACAVFAFGLFGSDRDTIEVRFVLDAPGAKTVYLAGDFSAWDTKGLELRRTSAGLWERTVRLRKGQSYSYNFLVDGTSWVVDPAAPERVDDGFGGESALIRL